MSHITSKYSVGSTSPRKTLGPIFHDQLPSPPPGLCAQSTDCLPTTPKAQRMPPAHRPPTASQTIQLCEHADALFLTRQALACAHLHTQPHPPILIQPIAGGVGIRTRPLFQGKLNRIVGLGMDRRVTQHDIRDAEKRYAEIGLYPQFHLSEAADPGAGSVLAGCGYVAGGTIGVYTCAIGERASAVARSVEQHNDIEVSIATPETTEAFTAASVAGFQDGGRAPAILHALARIAALREDTQLYVATIEGEIVGTAAMALIDAPELEGKVAHLYLDSTPPRHRGRGVHAALIEARLADAERAGFRFVSLATRPDGGSARNAERAGFALAYTKAVFVKDFP